MQNSEGGSDSPASVALHPAATAQPAPASPQRVLVQAAGPAPKVAQTQPISLPRVQQVSQQVQPVQQVYPMQVHYVEGGDAVYTNGALRTAYAYNPEPQLYAPSSAASYFEAPSGAQVTVASSPPALPPHSMVGLTMDVGGSPIVSSAGAYLIHGGMDGARHSLAHTARSSPATLQWLLDNYETAEGVSLPRSSLYNHYLRHCQEHKLDPVNAASFGKLIRSVFMGLRTRRLGTRGNSKYHYYGIRLKPDSPLNRLQEDTQYMAMRQQPTHQKPRYRPAQKTDSLGDSSSHSSLHSTPEQATAAHSQHHQQYIDVSHVFPEFPVPDLGSALLQESITLRDVKALQLAYRRHCEATLDVVINLQFHYIEKLWLAFWNSKGPASDGPASLPASDEEPEGATLSKDKLVSLCKCDPILRWMRSCDHILYQALVEILIPDVLRPVPSTLTQAIRNFAKSLEGWLTNAMSDFPQRVIQTKVGVVSAFAQTLRRYTSLNHLAQAARAVLQNTAQINQMLSDLNRVDFANVQEQASWVCQCEEGVVQRLEQDFKVTLQQQSSLDQWAAWLDGVVTQVLRQHAGSPSFPKAARQFLLKWSFYSSMVIRDLTLRSAASFGSFHLIRLLYDEYMFYLVEHRVAQATGETPIAVMGEFNDLASLSLTLLDKGPQGQQRADDDQGSLHSEAPHALSSRQGLPTFRVTIWAPPWPAAKACPQRPREAGATAAPLVCQEQPLRQLPSTPPAPYRPPKASEQPAWRELTPSSPLPRPLRVRDLFMVITKETQVLWACVDLGVLLKAPPRGPGPPPSLPPGKRRLIQCNVFSFWKNVSMIILLSDFVLSRFVTDLCNVALYSIPNTLSAFSRRY
ncbi:DNA-binding protein RFX2 isoform X3 [Ochotona princeps]|nr:DNA-binding protein RFX2 isoform X3 [Ochotona princeps]XP_058513752.1 DNA-binding protein RFX2 isoform X3 [Ochotona princeps]XP_058513753.1 DNA-binding protein RFX2 isoform X3 [Ochotona princeps]XP_058515881.1 DNA-binding protein RFX2 isoform X3 [Ochotona princeps]XP_058515882.1 DNA-binding protein RFX2 isoform X3 [Ochotona princeps]XP_058515883.1 DNA-binding protein RFX2 isoform X3 [Ochotona princeps]